MKKLSSSLEKHISYSLEDPRYHKTPHWRSYLGRKNSYDEDITRVNDIESYQQAISFGPYHRKERDDFYEIWYT